MPRVLQPHPKPPEKMGVILVGNDAETETKRHHRLLAEAPARRPDVINFFREALQRHHADDDKRKRIAKLNEALVRQGAPPRTVYPSNPSTRKGNFAEIVLAEYVVANERISLPVYRLRYNPNIDQSMKGDDVLAFDLDSKPMRILVGESKFRGDPRRADVVDIVEALLRSHAAKIPTSLQFVADMLYKEQKKELAERVEACQLEIVRGTARVEYVGLLLGNNKAANCIATHTPAGEPARLAMISLSLDEPDKLVDDCFHNLT